MKLYTEEELRKHLYNHSDEFFDQLTPIELPSEGDIIEASHTEIYQVTFNPFASGAIWMRDKIKNQQ